MRGLQGQRIHRLRGVQRLPRCPKRKRLEINGRACSPLGKKRFESATSQPRLKRGAITHADLHPLGHHGGYRDGDNENAKYPAREHHSDQGLIRLTRGTYRRLIVIIIK